MKLEEDANKKLKSLIEEWKNHPRAKLEEELKKHHKMMSHYRKLLSNQHKKMQKHQKTVEKYMREQRADHVGKGKEKVGLSRIRKKRHRR